MGTAINLDLIFSQCEDGDGTYDHIVRRMSVPNLGQVTENRVDSLGTVV